VCNAECEITINCNFRRIRKRVEMAQLKRQYWHLYTKLRKPTQNPNKTHTKPTQNQHKTHTKPTQNPNKTHTKPKQNPHKTHTKPTQNPHKAAEDKPMGKSCTSHYVAFSASLLHAILCKDTEVSSSQIKGQLHHTHESSVGGVEV